MAPRSGTRSRSRRVAAAAGGAPPRRRDPRRAARRRTRPRAAVPTRPVRPQPASAARVRRHVLGHGRDLGLRQLPRERRHRAAAGGHDRRHLGRVGLALVEVRPDGAGRARRRERVATRARGREHGLRPVAPRRGVGAASTSFSAASSFGPANSATTTSAAASHVTHDKHPVDDRRARLRAPGSRSRR